MMKLVTKESSSTLAKLLKEGKLERSLFHTSVAPLQKWDKEHSHKFTIAAPQSELANQWRLVFYSIPASKNPLNSENTGVIDDIPQAGKVHFLGGAFEETEITRKVTVAHDQSVVIPILTAGADNIGWDFSSVSGLEKLPVPYQFSLNDLRIINKAFIDTATGVSLKVNDELLISDANKHQYRVTSCRPYTLNLPPEDDILGYRAKYPAEWIKFPYTQGMQDGFWAELKNLPLGKNTIHLAGTVNYQDIDEMYLDYNKNGIKGDTPLEYVIDLYKNFGGTSSLDVTYSVNVLPRPAFNAQLRGGC